MAALYEFRSEPQSLKDLHELDRLTELRNNQELADYATVYAWESGDAVVSLANEIGHVKRQVWPADVIVLAQAVRALVLRGGNRQEEWRDRVLERLEDAIRIAVSEAVDEAIEAGSDK